MDFKRKWEGNQINFIKKVFQTGLEIVLRVVAIVVPAVWVVFLFFGIYTIALINGTTGIDMPKTFWGILMLSIIGSFIFLTISTVFNILGQNKNNIKMILMAGIFYIFTAVSSLFFENKPFLFICVIAALLCFTKFTKMKKQSSVSVIN